MVGHRPLEQRRTGIGQPDHRGPAVAVLAPRDEALAFQTVNKPGDVRLRHNHAFADLPHQQALRCAARDDERSAWSWDSHCHVKAALVCRKALSCSVLRCDWRCALMPQSCHISAVQLPYCCWFLAPVCRKRGGIPAFLNDMGHARR